MVLVKSAAASKPEMLERTVEVLLKFGVRYLVCIGGDTTYELQNSLSMRAGLSE
jgi:6-phosphofructokinase